MLYPGVVGVAGGRKAVLPAGVFFQLFAPPFRHIKRRVCQNIIRAQVGVLVIVKGVRRFGPQVELYAAYGQVHGRQTPGGGVTFLPVNGQVARALVEFYKAFALHEHSARTTAGVVHFVVFRRGHDGDHRFYHRGRRVELPAALAFRIGKPAQKVFVHFA